MESYRLFDDIPEMAHLDETRFFAEAEKVIDAQQTAKSISNFHAFTKIGDFLEGPIRIANSQQTRDLLGLPLGRRFLREITLQALPGQQIKKIVEAYWYRPLTDTCYSVRYEYPIQLLGYGSYSLCHFKNQGHLDPKLNEFFGALARNNCNFHRTILFSSGNYEIDNQPTIPLLKKVGGKYCANPDFFTNLANMARAAWRNGVILEVCLFNHHPIAAPHQVPMPPEFPSDDLGDGDWVRYKNFFAKDSKWAGLQQEIIQKTTQYLMNHWNVIYEVGNELRVPTPNDTYGEKHLKEWVAWAADLLKKGSHGKLVSTSTGIGNAASLNQIPATSYATFHSGQWFTPANIAGGMEAARLMAAKWGDKHVIMDDDGMDKAIRKDTKGIEDRATAALVRGGNRQCSFNHKGPYSPVNGFSAAGNSELQALGRAWQNVFRQIAPGVKVFIPKTPIQA